MPSETQFVPIIVTTTSDDRTVLDLIAKELVEKRLAACVQIGSKITSHYRWRGVVECNEEWPCVIKTARELYAAVESLIMARHNYDQPQIVAVEIAAVQPGYLDWLKHELHRSA